MSVFNSDQKKQIEKVAFKSINKLKGITKTDSTSFSLQEWNQIEDHISAEIGAIEDAFKRELSNWGSKKIILLILGEAPLSSDQYFYHGSEGNFLGMLKTTYKDIIQDDFYEILRLKGILVLDVYKYPIPTVFYDSTTSPLYYDHKYIEQKLCQIAPFVDNNTKAIFRYGKLLNKRNLKELKSLLNERKIHLYTFPLGVNSNSSDLNHQAKGILDKLMKGR